MGALSGEGTASRLARLNALRKRLLQASADSPISSTPPPPRIGDIARAVRNVLAKAREPMHTNAIHRAVERELGKAVNYRTVKACLSEEARKPKPLFERIARGEYRLA